MIDATDKLSLANRLACEKLIEVSRSTPGDNAYLHSTRVARYIREELGIVDENLQIAALLHDVVEDTDVTVNQIEGIFGKKVASMVSQLTRSSQPSDTQFEKIIRKIEQNLTLKEAPYAVRVIKCADRIDNLRSSESIPEDDQRYYKIPYWVIETRASMLPIAMNTHEKLYEDLKETVDNLESAFPTQVRKLVNNYLLRADISVDVREHLKEYMSSSTI